MLCEVFSFLSFSYIWSYFIISPIYLFIYRQYFTLLLLYFYFINFPGLLGTTFKENNVGA